MSLLCSGGEDKKLVIWDIETKKQIQVYNCFDGSITHTQFHPKDQCVLASTNNKTISMFDLRTEQIVQHYQAHHDAVNSFSIHPEGTHMVSVSSNSEVKVDFTSIQVWDLIKGTLNYSMYGHKGLINFCTFSKKGDYFATGGSDRSLCIWKSMFS